MPTCTAICTSQAVCGDWLLRFFFHRFTAAKLRKRLAHLPQIDDEAVYKIVFDKQGPLSSTFKSIASQLGHLCRLMPDQCTSKEQRTFAVKCKFETVKEITADEMARELGIVEPGHQATFMHLLSDQNGEQTP